MKQLAMTFVFLLSLCGSAVAENAPVLLLEGGIESLLVSRDNFAIIVHDQVTGGCLPNPNQLKEKMEVSLRENGLRIAKEADLFTNDIHIVASGYKIGKSTCAVSLSVDLVFDIIAEVPFAKNEPSGSRTFVKFVYQIGGVILTGDRYSMQEMLTKKTTDHADKLYLDISRSKDNIFSRFPSIRERIMNTKNKDN